VSQKKNKTKHATTFSTILNNKSDYAKNYCNRTLIGQVIVENVDTFSEAQCMNGSCREIPAHGQLGRTWVTDRQTDLLYQQPNVS